MSYSSTTPNLSLPQYTEDDSPLYRPEMNDAFLNIDQGISGDEEKLYNYQVTLGALSRTLDQLIEKTAAVRKQFNGARGAANRINADIDTAVNTVNGFESTLAALQTRMVQIKKNVADIQSEVNEAKATSDANKVRSDALEDRVVTLKENKNVTIIGRVSSGQSYSLSGILTDEEIESAKVSDFFVCIDPVSVGDTRGPSGPGRDYGSSSAPFTTNFSISFNKAAKTISATLSVSTSVNWFDNAGGAGVWKVTTAQGYVSGTLCYRKGGIPSVQ